MLCDNTKKGEHLKNQGFCYYYQCERDFNRAIYNTKRSNKRQQNSKEIKNEAPAPKKLRSAVGTFDSNQCLFSKEPLHDTMRDSKDSFSKFRE